MKLKVQCIVYKTLVRPLFQLFKTNRTKMTVSFFYVYCYIVLLLTKDGSFFNMFEIVYL